jgi:hypothetical protein
VHGIYKLGLGHGWQPGCSIGHDARQADDFGKPASVFFLFRFDANVHGVFLVMN